jgi:hypothetical protein
MALIYSMPLFLLQPSFITYLNIRLTEEGLCSKNIWRNRTICVEVDREAEDMINVKNPLCA